MILPTTPSFNLTGKRALIAGASSGIGLACAVALAEHGAVVTLAARRTERLQALAARLQAAGHPAEILQLDVADIEATSVAVAAAGPFDIFVNSAGLARHGKASDTTAVDYDAVAEVNIRLFFDSSDGKGAAWRAKARQLDQYLKSDGACGGA